jgi:hypothetical protein
MAENSKIEWADALQNILATIHRDGGHYATEHGIEKAATDAQQVWANREREIDQLREAYKVLREALGFYEDPETYHGIGFMTDEPCGDFASDFSGDHSHPHYGQKLGKRARVALVKADEIMGEVESRGVE